MNTVTLIAVDNIRALLHRRLLLGLMLVSVALTAVFSYSLSKVESSLERQAERQRLNQAQPGSVAVSASVDAKNAKFRETLSTGFQAFFYQAVSFGGSLVALFIFSTAVATEIRTGTIRVTLSKPVSRPHYLVGKFLGGFVVMAVYAGLSSIALYIFAHSHALTMSPTMRWAPLLMFSRQLMLGSLAMLLSLFVNPFVASILAFFLGNGLTSPPNPIYYLLPSYSSFNVFGQLFQGTVLSGYRILILELYAADFVILMLVFAWWRFRSKELL